MNEKLSFLGSTFGSLKKGKKLIRHQGREISQFILSKKSQKKTQELELSLPNLLKESPPKNLGSKFSYQMRKRILLIFLVVLDSL